jgi:putative NIF3 family GTP cyclohydrolase 1 type 2
VATAVFPSVEVIDQLRARGFEKGVLITHHPMDCNLQTKEVWSFPDADAIRFLRKAGIGLYALHTPLDRDGPCGTGRTFAEAIGIQVAGTFFPYEGHDAGLYGSTAAKDLRSLALLVESAVGHAVMAHRYCADALSRVGVVGGGINISTIEQAAVLGINVIVTGISVINEHSAAAHRRAKDLGISWIGATHYSSERFGCEKLAVWLRGMGMPAFFCQGRPDFFDRGDGDAGAVG